MSSDGPATRPRQAGSTARLDFSGPISDSCGSTGRSAPGCCSGPACSGSRSVRRRPARRIRHRCMSLLCGIGAIVMRGAGCTYNDIIDRDFDAQVERTRGRPIPSGAVSVPGRLGLCNCVEPDRALHTAHVQPLCDPAGRGFAVSDRRLSLHEAHHLVAAGLARSHLQLGRAVRLRRHDRDAQPLSAVVLCGVLLLDASATTSSTRTRTKRTTS